MQKGIDRSEANGHEFLGFVWKSVKVIDASSCISMSQMTKINMYEQANQLKSACSYNE